MSGMCKANATPSSCGITSSRGGYSSEEENLEIDVK